MSCDGNPPACGQSAFTTAGGSVTGRGLALVMSRPLRALITEMRLPGIGVFSLPNQSSHRLQPLSARGISSRARRPTAERVT
jgi:hypothetical protein